MSRPSTRFTICTLLLSALISVLALLVAGGRPETFRGSSGNKSINPLYARLRAVGKREGFDVDFAREVVHERQGPRLDHPLFSMPEHGVDVLLFGDSTAAWGITPQVIEAVSDLRVAMFAEPGMRLNEADSGFYQAIIEKYLAPNGRTLFCFAPKNIIREPDVPSMQTLSKEKLARAIAAHEQLEWWSFDGYWSWRTKTLSEPLSAWGLSLPRVALYRTWLEPVFNPAWSTQKRDTEARQGKGFIRWDGWTATINGPKGAPAVRSTQEPKKIERWWPKRVHRERAARNAEALKRLPGEKVMVVPLSTNKLHYVRLRALYKEYFADAAELIDLGKLMPKGVKYPMSDVLHMKDETGFEASVLIGKWLRQHPSAARSQAASATPTSRSVAH
jgi:hypothetical protein